MTYTRVEKRKNNITETKMEPPKKALKKNEVIAQYKSLQEKFQILQEQNRVLLENEKKNIESISLLEETVNILEEKVNAPKKEKSIVTVSVQTEIIRCEECEYPADDMHDLVDHMHGSHPLESYQDGMTCNHCGEELQTKSDLMMHIQKEHSEKVKVCDYFIEGMCTFGDLCWFSHDESKLLKEIKCIICDCNFGSKSLLMKHRKKEHRRKVPQCKNETNGCCQYGSTFCWFIHSDMNESESGNLNVSQNDDKNELIKKLFDMMENFARRLLEIERLQ